VSPFGSELLSPVSFRTLVEALLAAPPEKPFITVWEDEDCHETVTFGEFAQLAKIRAAAFHTQGLVAGDAVILIMPQGIPLMASRICIDRREFSQRNTAVTVGDTKQGMWFVSSGRCLSANRVRIVSPDGRDLADYEVGETVIQSDSLFRGYFNRADLSAEVLKDGWYWTGDLGFCIDGELYVSGRKKDLIIVAGKNIYPQDIEEIVSRHPAIHDWRVVAFGLYNKDQGTEEIIVAAELENEQDSKMSFDIERALRSAIVAEFDLAPQAIFLKAPPWIVKSTAGKPARSTTREKLLAEHPELAIG
jgi:acyl-CoA synthetase (AMP-forming)/AMP-acid ligase II